MPVAPRRPLSFIAILSATALLAGLFSPTSVVAAQDTTADLQGPAAIDRQVRNALGRTSALVHVEEGHEFAAGLAAARSFGLEVGTHYEVIKVFVAYGSSTEFAALAQHEAIEYIEANRRLDLFTNTSHQATRGKNLLNREITLPNGAKIDGTGVGVAVVDSGVDGTHPDLADRMGGNVKMVCVGHTASVGVGALNGWQECRTPAKTAVPLDDTDHPSAGGHGTHVAGTIAGTGSASGGNWYGAAPGATLYGVSIGTAVAVENAMDGLAWVLENHDKVTPAIKVANNSWGGGYRKYAENGDVLYDAMWKMQDALIAEGVTVVFAAGNSGGNGTTPTTAAQCMNPRPGLICVANYDDQQSGTRAGSIDSTSSRGAANDPTTWPDVAAPGTRITATCRLSLPVCNLHAGMVTNPPNLYSTISGTSMAAPHVAGIVAQIEQANPSLTPGEIELLLENTAHKFTWGSAYGLHTDPTNPGNTSSFEKGHGLVDALAAVEAALGGQTDPTPDPTPTQTIEPTPQPTTTETAQPTGSKTYYFHSLTGFNEVDNFFVNGSSFNDQPPGDDTYAESHDVPQVRNGGVGQGPYDPNWTGTIDSPIQKLTVDFWAKTPVGDALRVVNYDVMIGVNGVKYDLPRIRRELPVPTLGNAPMRITETFTTMLDELDRPIPLSIDPQGQPVTISIAGPFAVDNAGSWIVYDNVDYQSGFTVHGAAVDPDPTPTGTPTIEPTPTDTPTVEPTPTDSPTEPSGGTYPETPNDTYFGPTNSPVTDFEPNQWGMRKVSAPQAWQIATGAGIRVAVLDSGVDIQHEDLQCPGKLEVAPNTDMVANDSDPDDENSHGTHVAGIIGACTNNGKGVVGVAPDATIVPIRVLNAAGSGTDAQLIAGLERATQLGVHVINMSIGYPPGKHIINNVSQINAKIEAAKAAGIVLVAAAGNDSSPICDYPALAEDIICVGASDSRDLKAAYSTFPNKTDAQDVVGPGLVAPGGSLAPFCDTYSENILSTIPLEKDTNGCTDVQGYANNAGSSMASPHVAGAAALIYERIGGQRSRANVEKVTDAIIGGVDDLGTPGYDPVFGYGRLDAVQSLCAAVACGPEPEPTVTATGTPTATPTEEPTETPTEEPTPAESYTDEGFILVSNPASVDGGGVTENEFALTCSIPLSQGTDGWVFELPDGFDVSNTEATITGSGSLIGHDLDMYFYDADCVFISAENTEEIDESAAVPAGTKYIVANAFFGIDTTVQLEVAKASGPDPTPTATIDPTPTPTPTGSPTDPPTGKRGTYPTNPNDSLFGDQWGITKIQAPQAWQETNATGFGINIAVVDSGLDLGHEDFACPGKLKVLPGSDFVGNDGSPQDDDGHGTHVQGIAAACTNNDRGVVGVAPDATLIPVRWNPTGLDPSGLDEAMAEGIRFATANGAHVINLSIGDIPPFSHLGQFGYPETEDAMNEARNAGVVIAAAAGNFAQPTCEYPSFSRNVICVVATDRDDMRAWYTDFPVNLDPQGDPEIQPVVAAPGGQGTFCDEGIVSTYLRSEESTCYTAGYESLDGTSMASPHVAGLAALLYDRLGGTRNKANADRIVQTILETSDDLYSPGWDPIVGYGRVNALAAVQSLPEPEPSPTVTATATPTATATATPTATPTEPQAADTSLTFTENTSESAQYTDAATFEAQLTEATTGAPIAGADVAFELNGAEGGRRFETVTDATGIASVTVDIEEKPGLFDLIARYEGEEGTYNGDADSRTFIVDKEDAVLSLSVRGNRRAEAVLVDEDSPSQGVPDRTVDFSDNGTSFGSRATDPSGEAAIDLPRARSAIRTITADYAGDDYFLAASDGTDLVSYALLAGGDLEIAGSKGSVSATEPAADIHSNKNVKINDKSSRICGDIAAVGTVNNKGTVCSGYSVRQGVGAVGVPAMTGYMPGTAQATEVLQGDRSLNGYTCANADGCVVWVRNGKLEIRGTVTGDVWFLVDKEAIIKGSLQPGTDQSSVSIYSKMDVEASDSRSVITGTFFAQRAIKLGGSEQTLSGLLWGGSIELGGSKNSVTGALISQGLLKISGSQNSFDYKPGVI